MLTILITAAATFALCASLRGFYSRPKGGGRTRFHGLVRILPWNNEGAAFGLPIPQKVVRLLSAALLIFLPFAFPGAGAAAGLVLGGGLSNLFERVIRGSVLDYWQFPKAPKRMRRYVFNLADLALFAGVLGLVVHVLRKR